jgi:serine/threonine-protein kinase
VSTPDPFLGRELLGGQFKIVGKLGAGGIGAVYSALQPEMNRTVAVKILHPRFSKRGDLASRLRREARAMSQLTHPSIAKVFLHGELEDGSLYVVMERLYGRDLREALNADGPFPVERALLIVIAICGALGEAHAAGIVHRDLKPENIFLCQSGGLRDFPKVLDFGLAKVTEKQMRPGSIKLTGRDEVFGTPRFMSPEQAQARPLTPASDVYALALILYEMLTGKSPFDARDSLEYALLHVKAQPIPLGQRVPGKTFPVELERAVMKALAKSPEERHASTADLAMDLTRVLEAEAAPPPAPAVAPAARRFPTAVLLAFVVGALLAVAVTVLALR